MEAIDYDVELEEDAPVPMFEIVSFRVIGISPLLLHNPDAFIANDSNALSVSKKTYDVEEEASKGCYRDEDGEFCIKTESFTRAMVKAASGRKINPKMFATTAFRGSVFPVEEYSQLLGSDGEPIKGYKTDTRPVVIGKARVLRARPKFWPWKCDVALEVDMGIMQTEDIVREMLQLAGRIAGVGDFRPGKGGPFGRFRVEE